MPPSFSLATSGTRLFRLLAGHRALADRFLAEPLLVGICDSFDTELIHPKRAGRSDKQVGEKGLSNYRWIVGVKWCPLTSSRGQVVDWDAETVQMLIETLFSQITGVFGMKKMTERTGPHVEARLGFAAAAYDLLIAWGGDLTTNADGFVQLGMHSAVCERRYSNSTIGYILVI